MTKAIWNGATVADSDDVLLVEFAVYFPLESVAPGSLRESSVPSTYCHWKGVAEYYDVIVDGEVNEGGAWAYAEPYTEASAFDHPHVKPFAQRYKWSLVDAALHKG